MMRDTWFPCWVIYHNASDYPGKYVVRRQVIIPGALILDRSPSWTGDSLEEARRAVPDWAIRFPRDPQDDPVIVETWA